jgi:hypothetical protein
MKLEPSVLANKVSLHLSAGGRVKMTVRGRGMRPSWNVVGTQVYGDVYSVKLCSRRSTGGVWRDVGELADQMVFHFQ